VGLAMDATAVSIASGVIIKNPGLRHALLLGTFFGLFQAVMPVLGWLAGENLHALICNFDHWVAFGLLCFVGGKMIINASRKKGDKSIINPLAISTLLALSVATSIDAAAVGLSYSFLDAPIVGAAIIIGVVTFILSFTGVFIGEKVGVLFGKKIELFGGVMLVGIGVKILIEHLS